VQAIFSAPVHADPGAHLDLYTIDNQSLSRGVKRPGRGVNHPLPSTTEVKERVELCLCFPFGSSWSVIGINLLYRSCFSFAVSK
jgi:hypothetical protein